MELLDLYRGLRAAQRGTQVGRRVRRFDGWLDRATAPPEAAPRDYDHAETVREYYDLCSDFMVFGWGQSLHFAPLSPDETLEESKLRHQRLMIEKLQITEGMKVIDVGCGIGGPLRTVVREAGVRVVGVNSSRVQIARARALDAAAGISHMVDYLECSFMDMAEAEAESFDRGYAIESTCHAPDREGAYAEIYRVLRPGALFWVQEMCMTDRFDPGDERHLAMRKDLMRGIALRHIASAGEVSRALTSAGFEVIEGIDRALSDGVPTVPWYRPMEVPQIRIGSTLCRSPMGRRATIVATRLAEALGALPGGSTEVVRLLNRTANAYVAGGRAGIFTPLYCFLARKPLAPSASP